MRSLKEYLEGLTDKGDQELPVLVFGEGGDTVVRYAGVVDAVPLCVRGDAALIRDFICYVADVDAAYMPRWFESYEGDVWLLGLDLRLWTQYALSRT